MNYKIALIRGDGIGPEVVGEAVKVLEAVGQKFGHSFTYEEVLLGGCATDAVGKSYPDGTAEKCRACDAVLLGAVGGLLLGLSRACVAEFTFYLAIPVMAGASLLKVVKFVVGGSVMTGTEVAVLAVGCVVAFGMSLAAIRFLMDYVKRHDFKFFGAYRIVLGIIVLAVAAATAIF